MSAPFLTARWKHVVLVNFRAPADLLVPHLLDGTKLDTPDPSGRLHLVSVVALRFVGLRIRGIPVVTAQDFPEVNLRFYARQGPIGGSVFLRELVSRPAVVAGARLVFREPYALADVSHEFTYLEGALRAATHARFQNRSGAMEIAARDAPHVFPERSVEHWLKEHHWGFGRGFGGRTTYYRVARPNWRTYPVLDARIGIDPSLFMGGEWADVDWGARQHSIIVAEGSTSSMYHAEAPSLSS